jgi:hypothetical protein
VRRAFEEERHRDLKEIGDVLQAASADAIGPVLILLHLLDVIPSPLPSFSCVIPSIFRRHPDPAAYVLVDGVGDPFNHFLFHDFLPIAYG